MIVSQVAAMDKRQGNPMNRNKDVEMSQSPPLQSVSVSGSNSIIIPPIPKNGSNNNDNGGNKQRNPSNQSQSAHKNRKARRHNGISADDDYVLAFLNENNGKGKLDEDEIKSTFDDGVKEVKRAFGALWRSFEDTETVRRRLRNQQATISTMEDLKKRSNMQVKRLVEELYDHKTRIKKLQAENEHK